MRGSPEIDAVARELAARDPGAWPRIGWDLGLWISAALLGEALGWPWKLPLLAFVGFGPMHDLLIHGHDAVHRLVSRRRPLNEAALFLLHAPFGVSGTAHRAFHLAHHRWTHEERDPEWQVLRRLGGTGPSYLVLPAIAPLSVIGYALAQGPPGWRPRVVLELLAIAALHVALIALLGPEAWATWVVAPTFVGLGPAFVLRSIFEHHHAVPGDPWRNARTLDGGPVMALLWSNIDLHLEHHLFPSVPIRHLRELRAALAPEYARRGVVPARGYLRTALRLYGIREHFAPGGRDADRLAARRPSR